MRSSPMFITTGSLAALCSTTTEQDTQPATVHSYRSKLKLGAL